MKDNLAVACSGACMIHCLAAPLLIGFGAAGLLGEWLSSEWIHQLMLFPVILLAVLSLPVAYKRHKCCWPLLLGVMGIISMVTALVGPEAFETWITVSGGLLLISAHLWNRTLSLQILSPRQEPTNG